MKKSASIEDHSITFGRKLENTSRKHILLVDNEEEN